MSALITGGGGGLGRAVGQQLAARGVPVALVDKSREAAADAAAETAADGGAGAHGIAQDITTPAGIEAAWSEAEEQLGPVEIVVSAAGVFQVTDLVDVSFEQWNAGIALHLTAPFLLAQRAARSWIPAGTEGAIVNVSSIAAVTAQTGGSVEYGAGKAGVLGLTIDLAIELGQHGIRANAVLPGTFRSPLNAARLAEPEAIARRAATIPLGRIGTADEVARAVVFLALDGTYVNGALLPCDGGTVIKMF